MKKVIIIMALGVLAIGFLHANHFVPGWHQPYQNPYMAMNVFVRSAYVNGSPLIAGDELAVFDGDTCVGMTVMTKTAIIENGTTEIICSSEGGDVPGSATTGHFIRFKVWVQATNTEYAYPEMSVWFDTPIVTTFSPLGTTFVKRLQYDTPTEDASISIPANTYASVPLNYPDAHVSITSLGAFYSPVPVPTYYPNFVTTAGDIRVVFIEAAPIGVGFTGTAPDVYSQYHWYIDPGTVGFTADVDHPVVIRIDTSQLSGFVDYSLLTVYKRTIHGTPYFEACSTVWNDPYLDVSITSFSEFILAGPEESTLPIELSSFTASLSAQNYVTLHWVTQSETGVAGFRIYRSTAQDLAAAEVISPLIDATNTSNTQAYVYMDTELNQDGTYYYWLENADIDGSSGFHGPVCVQYAVIGGNNNPPVVIKDGINSIYPNPFNPTVYIDYGMSNEGLVEISVYNLRGQLIRRLCREHVQAGNHTVRWDGRSDKNSVCGSGIYLVRMCVGSRSYTRRVMLMK